MLTFTRAVCSAAVGVEKISINGWCSQRGHSASEDVQVQEAEAEEGVVCEQESDTDVFAVLYLESLSMLGGGAREYNMYVFALLCGGGAQRSFQEIREGE